MYVRFYSHGNPGDFEMKMSTQDTDWLMIVDDRELSGIELPDSRTCPKNLNSGSTPPKIRELYRSSAVRVKSVCLSLNGLMPLLSKLY